MVFELLTGLNRVDVFSAPLKKGVNVTPGTLVVIDSSGEVVRATPERAMPVYVCISNSEEPAVRAAGTVALVYGDLRMKTDNFVDDNYSPGDPLTVGPNGAFKKHTPSDNTPVVGYVEQVIDPANKVMIVRFM
ncbi:MAG: hypothetical protein QW650_00360 [Thermofilum sp.]